MNERVPEVAITISLPGESYIIGEEMPLTVSFTNKLSTAFSMKQPEKKRDVHLQVISADGGIAEEGFGRIFITHPRPGAERRVIEKADTVTLQPGESYSFKRDLMSRFPALLNPGNLTLRVIDVSRDDDTVASNELPVTIRFTRESVPRLMAVAGDDSLDMSNRAWAIGWLREVKADFRPKIAFEGAPEEEIAESNESIRNALESFRSWWATAEYSDSVAAEIRAINDRYFVIEKEPSTDEE